MRYFSRAALALVAIAYLDSWIDGDLGLGKHCLAMTHTIPDEV
jgi:hypothetical protein